MKWVIYCYVVKDISSQYLPKLFIKDVTCRYCEGELEQEVKLFEQQLRKDNYIIVSYDVTTIEE